MSGWISAEFKISGIKTTNFLTVLSPVVHKVAPYIEESALCTVFWIKSLCMSYDWCPDWLLKVAHFVCEGRARVSLHLAARKGARRVFAGCFKIKKLTVQQIICCTKSTVHIISGFFRMILKKKIQMLEQLFFCKHHHNFFFLGVGAF